VQQLSGRVWSGRAALSGGYALDWRMLPGVLLRGRLEAAFTFAGPDSRVEGRAVAARSGLGLADLSGRLGGGSLTLLPDLAAMRCDMRAVLSVERLSWRRGQARAAGDLGVTEGACLLPDGRRVEVPVLHVALSTDGADALALVESDGPAPQRLAQARLTGGGRVQLRVEPEGAALIPGMPRSAPTEIDLPIAVLLSPRGY
jgi:hypothetical protein